MASSHHLSLFPDLNDPSSSPGPSAPALTYPSLLTLIVEQVMAAQTDIEANHYTLKSCIEIVAAVSNLSHRLQNKTCEAENKELKQKATSMENKEVKRQATSMARFGAPSYFSFDGRGKVNSLGENTEAGPLKVSQNEN
ncbi:hypothetical protein ACSBR2_020075 [Camellia fascicularis]